MNFLYEIWHDCGMLIGYQYGKDHADAVAKYAAKFPSRKEQDLHARLSPKNYGR